MRPDRACCRGNQSAARERCNRGDLSCLKTVLPLLMQEFLLKDKSLDTQASAQTAKSLGDIGEAATSLTAIGSGGFGRMMRLCILSLLNRSPSKRKAQTLLDGLESNG